MLAAGARRAVVTDGHASGDATGDGLVSATPPRIEARRITGAGDTFMAAHIAAELGGRSRAEALGFAVAAAARYVEGHDHG
jgi:Fructose-1-phosphate kinase and related fructose-6-phosphate kinase (PfkB)